MVEFPSERTIKSMGYNIVNGQKQIILILDDGSRLTIKESGGPGADANWYTYPEIVWQKDGKTLARWTL